MSSSCDQVLAVTELLEAILLELPVRDMFRARRISKTWRNVSSSSPRIQEKLFLKPSEGPIEPTGPNHDYPRHFRINPNFLSRVNCELTMGRGIRLNPNFPRMVTMARIMPAGLGRESPILKTNGDWDPGCESLRFAFITQPPCTTAKLAVFAGDGPTMVVCSLRNPEGLNHGDIWKAAGGMLAGIEGAHRTGSTPFQIHVKMDMMMTNAEAEEWEEDWRRGQEAKKEFEKSQSRAISSNIEGDR